MTFGVRDTVDFRCQALFYVLCLGAVLALMAVPRNNDCVGISQGHKILVAALRGDCEALIKCSAPRASLLRDISPTMMVVLLIDISCPGACGAGISDTSIGGTTIGVRCCWGI